MGRVICAKCRGWIDADCAVYTAAPGGAFGSYSCPCCAHTCRKPAPEGCESELQALRTELSTLEKRHESDMLIRAAECEVHSEGAKKFMAAVREYQAKWKEKCEGLEDRLEKLEKSAQTKDPYSKYPEHWRDDSKWEWIREILEEALPHVSRDRLSKVAAHIQEILRA